MKVRFMSRLLDKEVIKEFSNYQEAKEFAIRVNGIIVA